MRRFPGALMQVSRREYGQYVLQKVFKGVLFVPEGGESDDGAGNTASARRGGAQAR